MPVGAKSTKVTACIPTCTVYLHLIVWLTYIVEGERGIHPNKYLTVPSFQSCLFFCAYASSNSFQQHFGSWVAMNFFFCAAVRDLRSWNWRIYRKTSICQTSDMSRCIENVSSQSNRQVFYWNMSHASKQIWFHNPTKVSLLTWDFSLLR